MLDIPTNVLWDVRGIYDFCNFSVDIESCKFVSKNLFKAFSFLYWFLFRIENQKNFNLYSILISSLNIKSLIALIFIDLPLWIRLLPYQFDMQMMHIIYFFFVYWLFTSTTCIAFRKQEVVNKQYNINITTNVPS